MSYDPHRHVKIWISTNPNEFLNLENQVRLIEMREKNPFDVIHFIYSSYLLDTNAIRDMEIFCTEFNIIPLDADGMLIQSKLKSVQENLLYKYYQDEIMHLDNGGNPAVASDILRWLSPIYKLGTYTDFDVPINTSKLPAILNINTPLIMNIGSLKIHNKHFILVNNDFIACNKKDSDSIQKIQNYLLQQLQSYDNNFIEDTITQTFRQKNLLLYRLLNYLKTYRNEALYIEKSKNINKQKLSSRKLRAYICDVMSDQTKFIAFQKIHSSESYNDVIKRLKHSQKKQLTLMKFLFSRHEYNKIKLMLQQNNKKFIEYLMHKELDLYKKAIVVCTTGPLAISKAIFDAYIVNKNIFYYSVLPLSFRTYNLHKAFKSNNSIAQKLNIIQMLKFLGSKEGTLNDSSWLESGKKLQQIREQNILIHKQEITQTISQQLLEFEIKIQQKIEDLQNKRYTGLLQYLDFFQHRRNVTINILLQILDCFDHTQQYFDTEKFKQIASEIEKNKFNQIILIKTPAKELFQSLSQLIYHSIIFRLTKDKKIFTQSS